MKTTIHAVAGGLAFLIISLFWLSSLFSETLGGPEDIAMVKTGILYGMAVLIPALMITGGSGFSLGRGGKSAQITAKARRMKMIAANGLIVLLPSAAMLAYLAASRSFNTLFYAVQGLELVAGAVNLALIGLNIKAGAAIMARRKARA